MAGVSGGDHVLAQRLNHLFVTVHPAGRGPYTLREVADAINRRGGRDDHLGLLPVSAASRAAERAKPLPPAGNRQVLRRGRRLLL